jgi:hypothetical protein
MREGSGDFPIGLEGQPPYPRPVRRLLGWVLFFQMARVVCAGLGDDGDTIEEAYGGPKSRQLRDDGTIAIVYQKDRYLYQVVFQRGVSVSEEYSRTDRAVLSEKEIARFLKMNGGAKMPWGRTDTAQGRRFERDDHLAEAIATGPSLKVRTKK